MEEAVRYSSANGERNHDGVSTSDAVRGLFCRGERLRRADRTGFAEAGHWRHAVYTVGAGGQDGLCGGIFQRLGQGSYADEASGQ